MAKECGGGPLQWSRDGAVSDRSAELEAAAAIRQAIAHLESCGYCAAARQLEAKFPAVTAPQVGETWFVKLAGASTLLTIEVLELTAATVRLKRPDSHHEQRYAREDLRFIERASGADNG